MGCVGCTQEDEIIEIDGVIARPNTITEQWEDGFDRKALPHLGSDSSVWTQYTGVMIHPNVCEGNETIFNQYHEGDETTNALSPGMDGYQPTGGASYEQDGYVTGGDHMEADGFETRPVSDLHKLHILENAWIAPQGNAVPMGYSNPMVGETYTSRFNINVNLDSPTAHSVESASAVMDVYTQSPSMESAQSVSAQSVCFDNLHTALPRSANSRYNFSPQATPSPMGSEINLDSLCSFDTFSPEEPSTKREPNSQRNSIRVAEEEYHKRRLIKTSSSTFGYHE